jgi:diacylglycerol kinase family enzyme
VSEEATRGVEAELARVGEVRTVFTERARHATELSEDGHPRTDAIVVFSGDGGYNEVLNGSDGTTPLGFVPGGGTSVLPRALGLPRDPLGAARAIADAIETGRTRRIGLGRVNGRRFAFAAGLGVDAELIRRVDELGRRSDGRRPGDLAFVGQLVRLLASHRARFDPVLEIEGHGPAALVFVANGNPYTYAGAVPLAIVPGAEFDDGLALLAPRSVAPAKLPRLVPALLSGHGVPPDVIHEVDLDRILVTASEPLPLQADGEDLGDVDHAVFEAERGAVDVLV